MNNPYYYFVDKFIYEYDNEDKPFCNYLKENINIKLPKNINIELKEKYYVYDLDYRNITLFELDDKKLIEYPPYFLFYDKELMNLIKNKFNKEIINKKIKIIKIPITFDWKKYKMFNKINGNITDVLNHYENNNKANIKVELPMDFSEMGYRILNKLDNLNDIEIRAHYLKNKLDYKLDLPFNFNIIALKSNNPLLRKMTDFNAIRKFIKNKKLKYYFDNIPYDFDPIVYGNINNLHKKFKSSYELYYHYEKIGFYQGRKYK